MRHAGERELLADERGTASVETVVILPLIALCWAGVFFFFEGYEASIIAGAKARREAWLVSFSACEGVSKNIDCSAENGTPPGQPVALTGNTDWIDKATQIPFVGGFIESVFGSSTTVSVTEQFEPPGLIGDEPRSARYTYKIMCNLKRTSVQQVIEDTFCGMIETVGLTLFCDGSATQNACN